ncbi:hypothetical protein OSTOST_08813 [Ostertagia ostertagi]
MDFNSLKDYEELLKLYNWWFNPKLVWDAVIAEFALEETLLPGTYWAGLKLNATKYTISPMERVSDARVLTTGWNHI